MTDYTAILMTVVGLLTVGFSIALWLAKTSRDVIHDVSDIITTYKEAIKDKRITHTEKDAIIDKIEILFTNMSENVKKLLLPRKS